MELAVSKVEPIEVNATPPRWQIITLGELFEFKNGLNKEKKYFGYGTPIVNYMDVYKNRGLTSRNITGKVSLTKQEIKIYDVRKGDVFFTRTSETVEEIGISSVMLEEVKDAVFSGFILRARPKTDFLADEFKKYCFSTSLVRKEITSKSSYTTRALTNGKLLSAVKIIVPERKQEQIAIANALGDADVLIFRLEKLIEKKRNIRQGALQNLLSGKKRWSRIKNKKGFEKTELATIPNDWIACTFQDVVSGFSSGQTPYREIKRFYEGTIPWITSGELNYNIINDTLEKITPEAVQKTNLQIIPKGTFLFAITGLEAEGTRGSCAITGVDATTNQSCMALYPKPGKLMTKYLYYFYVMYGDALAFKYCQGTKQQSYTGAIARTLPIHLPPTIEEQAFIVDILSNMDAELAALEIKLKKQRHLKIGMMQNLLTGKIRLM